MTGLITEVCSTLPQGVIFRDWQTIFAMLLRDNISGNDTNNNNNLIVTSPLTEMQSSILIHLLVSNAILVKNIHTTSANTNTNTNNNEDEVQLVVGNESMKYTHDILHTSCHSNLMHAIGSGDFMKMLVRYKEEYYNSSILSMLIECVDSNITIKSLQNLTSFVVDAFEGLIVTPPKDARSTNVQHTIMRRYVRLFSQWDKNYINITNKNTSLSLATLSIENNPNTNPNANPDPLGASGSLSKLSNVVETQLNTLLNHYWSVVSNKELVLEIRIALETEKSDAKPNTNTKSKKKKTPTHTPTNTSVELIQTYYNAIVKFTLLLKHIDCINTGPMQLFDREDIETSILPQLKSNINAFVGFGQELCGGSGSGMDVDMEVIDCCMDISKLTCDMLFTITMWHLRSVYCDTLSLQHTSTSNKKLSAKKIQEDSEKIPRIEEGIELICTLREHIVNEFYTPWMQLEDTPTDGPDGEAGLDGPDGAAGIDLESPLVLIQSGLRRYAFRMMGELRLLFPTKLIHDNTIPIPTTTPNTTTDTDGIADGDVEYVGLYTYVNKLVYTPSQSTLQAMKCVFEAEREYVDILLSAEIAQLSDSHENEEDFNISGGLLSRQLLTTTHNLLHDLLLPLGKPLLFDIEHLNRRQASAIVPYITTYSMNGLDVTGIQGIVIAWLKKLKSIDVIKFLEIQ